MWKKSLAFAALLALVILLDPTHTPAQPPGGMGGKDGRREFRFGGAPPGGVATSPAAPGGPTAAQPGSFPQPGGGIGGPPGGGFGGRSFGGPPGGGMGGPPGGGFGGPPGGGMGGPPGGGSDGRRRGMDPEQGWRMLQGASGSTGDTIDLSKIPPQTHAMMKGFAERTGSIPLPETGIMTKAQYLDHAARSEQARADFAARGGASGMGGPPGGGFGGPPGGGFGGPMGGFGGNNDPAEMALRRIRELDRNGDGRVSLEEADSRLRDRFREIDRNGDGSVDTEEYIAYYRERFGGGSGGPGGPPGDWNQGGWGGREDQRKQIEEERPIALRYGKIPEAVKSALPSWYDEFDTDKDAQVSLYEWRKGQKEMKEFLEMDLNGDGLVTPDEYIRFARAKNIATKVTAFEAGEREAGNWNLYADPKAGATGDRFKGGPGGGPPGFGPGSKGSDKGNSDKGNSDKEREREREKGKGNPWSKGKN